MPVPGWAVALLIQVHPHHQRFTERACDLDELEPFRMDANDVAVDQLAILRPKPRPRAPGPPPLSSQRLLASGKRDDRRSTRRWPALSQCRGCRWQRSKVGLRSGGACSAVDDPRPRRPPTRPARADRLHAGRIGRYTFAAPTRYDKLFAGIVAPRPAFVPQSREGCEHIGVADRPDADYGVLLERAYGKGITSPTGTAVGWPMWVDGFGEERAA